jgi:rod shape-determining protein MreB and related proteins
MYRRPHLAVDLGNANTRIYAPGRGVLVDEPSVVAFGGRRRSVIAVGSRAKAMVGRNPVGIDPVYPLRHGVVYEVGAAEQMLASFLQRMGRPGLRPRVLVSVPAGANKVERRSVEQAAHSGGAATALIIEEPLAAAIGAGLPVDQPAGGMLVDVGAGITEAAVVSLGSLVASHSARVGGDEADEAIAEWARLVRGVAIGMPTAERVKIAVGSADPGHDVGSIEVVGLHLASGLPRRLVFESGEVREAIEPVVRCILSVVQGTLEETPPELSADLAGSGIVLGGGMARLRGLGDRIAGETGIPVTVPGNPERAVVTGSARCVDEPRLLDAALAGVA